MWEWCFQEEREARELVKREQDEAYQASLRQDRAKVGGFKELYCFNVDIRSLLHLNNGLKILSGRVQLTPTLIYCFNFRLKKNEDKKKKKFSPKNATKSRLYTKPSLKRYACLRLRSHFVPEYDSHQNSSTMPMPWCKVLTLYSGTEWYLGIWSTSI